MRCLKKEGDKVSDKEIEELQEQLESLKSAFNSSYDGIHILDKDGFPASGLVECMHSVFFCWRGF